MATAAENPTPMMDAMAAARLRQELPVRFPQLDLSVEIELGRAVVSGWVQTLATRREVLKLIDEARGIRRVIDELQVEPHADANA